MKLSVCVLALNSFATGLAAGIGHPWLALADGAATLALFLAMDGNEKKGREDG